jgi:hypothetical protein
VIHRIGCLHVVMVVVVLLVLTHARLACDLLDRLLSLQAEDDELTGCSSCPGEWWIEVTAGCRLILRLYLASSLETISSCPMSSLNTKFSVDIFIYMNFTKFLFFIEKRNSCWMHHMCSKFIHDPQVLKLFFLFGKVRPYFISNRQITSFQKRCRGLHKANLHVQVDKEELELRRTGRHKGSLIDL